MCKLLPGLNWSQLFSELQTKEKSEEMSSHIPSIVFRCLPVQRRASVWDILFSPDLVLKNPGKTDS